MSGSGEILGMRSRPQEGNRMSQAALRNRIRIEEQIVERCIADLLAAGYSLGVHDGEEITIHHSQDAAAVKAAMFTTDEVRLFVYKTDGPQGKRDWFGWVFFVYGNDGWDVINDHTCNLEDALKGVDEYAETFER